MQHLVKASLAQVAATVALCLGIVLSAGGGGDAVAREGLQRSQLCTIERRAGPLSCEEFSEVYLGRRPVIFTTRANRRASAAYARERLLRDHGRLSVALSTANTYTGRVFLNSTLAQYVREHLEDRTEKLGNETFYLFGGTSSDGWESVLDLYAPPRFPSESILSAERAAADPELRKEVCAALRLHTPGASDQRLAALGLPRRYITKTFGLAGAGTGVPFHFHGPGFNELLVGRKRWHLSPHGSEPPFDPNRTSLSWSLEVLPEIEPRLKPQQCDLGVGEVLYFPSGWWHQTINLSPYTCWVATFA